MKALMEALSKMWEIPRNYYGVNLSHTGMHHLKNSESLVLSNLIIIFKFALY